MECPDTTNQAVSHVLFKRAKKSEKQGGGAQKNESGP